MSWGGGGGGGVLMRPNDIYKFKALSPKDYYLLPGEGAIKLVGS